MNLDYPVRRVDGIRAGRQVDDDDRRRLVVGPAIRLVILRAEFNVSDVAHAQQRAVRQGTQHNVFKLRRVDQPPDRVDRILKIRATGRRLLPERARGILPVLRCDGVADVRRREAQLCHLIGIGPDPHPIVLAGGQARIAHAWQTPDLVHQVDRGVIIQKQVVVTAICSRQADRHQERRRHLLHRDALPLYFRRQQRQRDRDLVLRLHRRQIDIRTQFVRHVDRQRAVVRAARKEVQHAIQAYKLLLDRLRYGLFEILRISAAILRSDLYNRGHHLRISRYGQIGNSNSAQYDEDDRDHHREDGTIDKESRHPVRLPSLPFFCKPAA